MDEGMNKTISRIVVTIFIFISEIAAANEDRMEGKLNPVVIDSKDISGATLGLEYELKGKFYEKSFSSSDAGSSDLNPEAPIGSISVGYDGSGTIATSKERNPKNFLDMLVDFKFLYSGGIGAIAGGLFTKYEADQSFDNSQFIYGLRLTSAKYSLFDRNDFIALDANYGRVDPKEDEDREAILGEGNLDTYYRLDLEFLYMYTVKWKMLETAEFNYRYFREINPPSAVKRSGTDTHRLGTLRVGLPNNMFVAYSQGKLPFDQMSSQIYEIGFIYQFY